MMLRYLLIDKRISWLGKISKRGTVLFLVTPDEENTVRAILRKAWSNCRVIDSGEILLSEQEKQSETLETLNRKSGSLVLTSKPMRFDSLISMLWGAHVQGKEVNDLNSFMMAIEHSVSTASNQFLQLYVAHGVRQGLPQKAYFAIKMVLEPIVAVAMLILFFPIFVLTAILIKMTSPGPVLYRQTRVGYRGRPFEICKFRSMRTDAEKDGPVWATAAKADRRLTPIGKILRATHLDELPQLWNVALGQLAFIGPRPERPVFVEKLSKDVPLFKLRTLVRPGITGWAQVHQGYANSVEDSRHKLELDLFYIMTNSVALDIQVILMTISLILFSGGTEGKKRRSGGVITRKRSFYSNYLARKPEAPSPIQLATITDIGRAKSSYRN